MSIKMVWQHIAVAVALMALPVSVQALPEQAQELLEKLEVIDSYQAEFSLEALEETGERVRIDGNLLYEKPASRRLEVRQDGNIAQLLVSDGNMEWQVYPDANVAYRMENPPAAPGPHEPFGEVVESSVTFLGTEKEAGTVIAQFEAEPKPETVADAPVTIEKVRIDIAESNGLVRRLALVDDTGQDVLVQTFSAVKVNVNPSSEQFLFEPQEGVAVVDVDPSELGL